MILVSDQGPNPSFFFFCGTFIQLGGLLGQGLGPGLDNSVGATKNQMKIDTEYRMYLKELDTVVPL